MEGQGQIFNDLLDKYPKIASMALNRTAKTYRTVSARTVREQVNLPASYVSPSQGRLSVSKKASESDLESRISARNRATSLSRYVKGSPRKGYHKRLSLEIKKGKTSSIEDLVMVNLTSGDTKNNKGLAVRSRTMPSKAYRPKRLGNSRLWLLYGPSVAQVLSHESDDGGVWAKADRQVSVEFKAEFYRLLGVA